MLSGIIFEDHNENGVQDEGENGYGGNPIYLLDANNNRVVRDPDGSGNFVFDQLLGGNYAVYMIEDGFTVTSSKVVMASIESGGSAYVSFGITIIPPPPSPEPAPPPPVDPYTGIVSGIIFEDHNENVVQDEGENGYGGNPIYLLDANNNRVVGDPDGIGNFVFDQLPSGNYAVYMIEDGFTVTSSKVVMASIGFGGSAYVSFGITIVPPPPPPEPPPPSPLIGDANQDGVLNSLDITKTERLVAGLD